jgi:hypothetical protein
VKLRFRLYSDETDPIRRKMRPTRREIDPKALTVRALRKYGFGVVCAGEPEDHANSGRLFSGTLTSATLIGLVLSLKIGIGLSLLDAILVVITSFLILLLAAITLKPIGNHGMLVPTIAQIFLLSFWVIVGILMISKGRGSEITITHVAPFAVAVVIRWAIRAVNLATQVPLFIPAALVIVVAPLFTGDPWHFVALARARLFFVAIITITPLLALAVVRFNRLPLDPVFERAAKTVEDNRRDAVDTAKKILRKRVLTREHWPRPALLESFLHRPYQPDLLHQEATKLNKISSKAFYRRAVFEFMSLTIGTFVATFTLVYMLAIFSVPLTLAQDWSTIRPKTIQIHTGAVLHLTLPIWPYLGVALMFSIVATVGFLAFALTEESYTTALVDATFGRLARLLIIVGAPFLFSSGAVRSSSASPLPENKAHQEQDAALEQAKRPALKRPPTKRKSSKR